MNKLWRQALYSFLGIIGAALIGTGIWWYYTSTPRDPIYPYDEKRDRAEILEIFKNDKYWLLSSPDYSPEFMLKHRAPNMEYRYFGKLNIDVYREPNKLAGFVAYYMKEPTLGFLLFLDVIPEFRGKEKGRHAERLLYHAFRKLKEMGATQIQILTRLSNIRAQKVYRRVGFRDLFEDDGFIYLVYDVPAGEIPAKEPAYAH